MDREADPAAVFGGRLLVGSALLVRPAGGVAAVINCAHEVADDLYPTRPTLRLEWREVAGEYLRDVRDEVMQFVDRHLESRSGPVLIHCSAGKSRSVSVACMVLVLRGGRSLQQAFCEILAQRPSVEPNGDLWEQLCEMFDAKHLTQNHCRAAMLKLGGETHFNHFGHGGVVSSFEEWNTLITSFQGSKKGHHVRIVNATIDDTFAAALVRPPRSITLIKLIGCTVESSDMERKLKSRMHISFFQGITPH